MWGNLDGEVLVLWWFFKQTAGEFRQTGDIQKLHVKIRDFEFQACSGPANNKNIVLFSIQFLRWAKLMVASWFVKLIWDLILTKVRVNHLTNRHPRSYFALIIIIQVNVICKFYYCKSSKGTTRSDNTELLDSMVKTSKLWSHPNFHTGIHLAWPITMERRWQLDVMITRPATWKLK